MTSPYTQPEPLPPAGGQPYPPQTGQWQVPPATGPHPVPPPQAGYYPPPQPQWGYGPGYPPPPPKKKIPVWAWPLFVVAGALAIGVVALGASGGTADAGSAVRDGQFEFHVTKVEQGATHVGGPGIFGDSAEGEFVVVHVHVSNIGKEESTFYGSNQKLIDDQGREYKGKGETLGHSLNPGFESDQVVAFDVPPGTTPKKFEFHDSMLSGGVTVKAK